MQTTEMTCSSYVALVVLGLRLANSCTPWGKCALRKRGCCSLFFGQIQCSAILPAAERFLCHTLMDMNKHPLKGSSARKSSHYLNFILFKRLTTWHFRWVRLRFSCLLGKSHLLAASNCTWGWGLICWNHQSVISANKCVKANSITHWC